MIILAYLGSIAIANLLAARYGPAITPFTAFALIGLDLTLRDRLHDTLPLRSPRWWPWQMAGLIAAGGLLSWAINAGAGRIALGSTIAFVLASTVDALVYHRLGGRPWRQRANGSNVAGAIVDSIAFPLIAFGAVPLWVIGGQIVAKIGGGAFWVWVLDRRRARAARDAAARSEV